MTAGLSRVILMAKEELKMNALPLHLQQAFPGVATLHELHWSMQNKALVKRIFSSITRSSRSLLDLKAEVSKRRIVRQYYAGSRTVAIHRIKGSEGRSDDFDCDFNPLHSRTRDRWISVALARFQGDTLPLVELIQMGDDYYVRDGHHRISVARGLGEEYVDSKVIVLELEQISTS